MQYTNYATIKKTATEPRLNELHEALKNLNCRVNIDTTNQRLECALQDNDSSWLDAGRLMVVFLSFNDVINWEPEKNQRWESISA